jgi:hypothetical protein
VIRYGEWLERKGLAEFAVFGQMTITQARIDRVEELAESHRSPLTRAGRTMVAAGKSIGSTAGMETVKEVVKKAILP